MVLTAPPGLDKRADLNDQRGDLLIYGATGYTGRLVAEACLARGLAPILAGRDGSRVAELAGVMGLRHRVARLEAGELERALNGIAVVLNAAGPFVDTAHVVADACLRTAVHYLDVSGEIDAIGRLRGRHREARNRGIMLLPAVGFDVVPSDCLALHVAGRLPGARRLTLGISGLDLLSRGSARTLVAEMSRPVRVLREGELVTVPPGSLERGLDFGDGPRPGTAVGWADVITAHHTTGIPSVTVYFEATGPIVAAMAANRRFGWLFGSTAWQIWMKAFSDMLPDGPSPAVRATRQALLVAEVEDASGRRLAARLRSPEAYTMTGLTASAIAVRVLDGDFEPGFHTPARVYGPDFVLSIDGVSRSEVEDVH